MLTHRWLCAFFLSATASAPASAAGADTETLSVLQLLQLLYGDRGALSAAARGAAVALDAGLGAD